MLVLFSMFEDYPEDWSDTDSLYVNLTSTGRWRVGDWVGKYRPLGSIQEETLRYYGILEEGSVGIKRYYGGYSECPVIFLDYSNEYYPVGKIKIYTSYGRNIPTNTEGLYTYRDKNGGENVLLYTRAYNSVGYALYT